MVEPRRTEVGAQGFAEALLVAEHDSEQNSAALAVKVACDRTRKPGACAVANATESTTMSDQAPAVAGEYDMNAVSAKPGPLVEAVARAARKLRLRAHHQDCAARRRAPEGKLELCRLVKDERAEPSDANRHLEVEAPSPRRGGHHNKGLLGASDLRL